MKYNNIKIIVDFNNKMFSSGDAIIEYFTIFLSDIKYNSSDVCTVNNKMKFYLDYGGIEQLLAYINSIFYLELLNTHKIIDLSEENNKEISEEELNLWLEFAKKAGMIFPLKPIDICIHLTKKQSKICLILSKIIKFSSFLLPRKQKQNSIIRTEAVK